MHGYENPLVTRYASPEMSALFGRDRKFGTWRRLWLALAEAEKELGLEITDDQLGQMKAALDDIDYDRAREIEKQTRHDVMAHIKTFAEAAPEAAPIIHLGATSCFVADNTDCIILKEALGKVRAGLLSVISGLSEFARRHADDPVRGYTHFQVAQPTTAGKRACLWLQDAVMDIEDLDAALGKLAFRGVKGTTGTQASFMALFDNDEEKVKKLDSLVAGKMGFEKVWPVTGQTYPRKQDIRVLNVLAGIAASAMKFASDIRLLQHRGELFEPFGKGQVGSSAMAYKRNPMRSERIESIGRYVLTVAQNGPLTAAGQWLERTLDDSANRRIVLAEAFLAVDGILRIWANIADGMVFMKKRAAYHLGLDMPFIATENLIMAAVKAGGDRQEAHEAVRKATDGLPDGDPKDAADELLRRLKADPMFKNVNLPDHLDPNKYVGRAPGQTREFLSTVVKPLLAGTKTEKPQDLDV